MSKGFGLIQAIMFIVILSAVALLVIQYSKISVKHTADTYIKEQANVFAQSAIEFSILAILGYERNATSRCLKDITVRSPDKKFIATVSVTDYMVETSSSEVTDCNIAGVNVHETLVVEGNLLHGSGYLNVVVESNSSHPRMENQPPIRIFKRVWQKF
jgi:hypothetical protein